MCLFISMHQLWSIEFFFRGPNEEENPFQFFFASEVLFYIIWQLYFQIFAHKKRFVDLLYFFFFFFFLFLLLCKWNFSVWNNFMMDKEIVDDFTFYWNFSIFWKLKHSTTEPSFDFSWKTKWFLFISVKTRTKICFCLFKRIESAFWNSKYSKCCCETWGWWGKCQVMESNWIARCETLCCILIFY